MNGFNIVKEIGRSFIVSSFVPAALFVLVIGLLFVGFVPTDVLSQIEKFESLMVILGTSFAIFTVWLSLLLYSSVDWVVNIFAGYYLPEFVSQVFKILLMRDVGRKIYNIKYMGL